MSTSSWIPVKAVGGFIDRVVKGVSVKTRPSPHDVPVSMRKHFDKTTHRLILEIKYLDDELADFEKRISKEVIARIGRKSGRVHSLEFTLSKSPNKVDLAQLFDDALGGLDRVSRTSQQKPTNATIVEKSIEENPAVTAHAGFSSCPAPA